MSFNLTREVHVGMSDSLKRRLIKFGLDSIQRSVEKAKENALIKLRELIISVLKNSPVYKGLHGDFAGYTQGTDLQAEFGLTDGAAQKALQSLVEILEKTCHIYYKVENNKVVVDPQVGLDPKEYEDQLKTGPEFQYKSSEKYDIQWMVWLLEASTDIVGQTMSSVDSFGITYDLTDKQENSPMTRSKRALMTQDKSKVIPKRFGQSKAKSRFKQQDKTANFPYVLPKICLPFIGSSKNFIEDITKSREFRFMVTNVVEKEIFKVLNPRKHIPERLK